MDNVSLTPNSDLLKGLLDTIKTTFLEDRTILSFNEYFALAQQNPQRHLRSSAQYLVDMLHHFGSEELDLPTGKVTRFKLFDAPFLDGEGRVAGHEAVQENLYRILANFAREGRVNKLILLHGPNGSAKSSICRALMAGMEAYARLSDGAMYTFNWIFPNERLRSADRIGFGSAPHALTGNDTFAYLTAENIDARVPCEMHDHPFFLLPTAARLQCMRQLLPDPQGPALASVTAPPPNAQAGRGAQAPAAPRTALSDYLCLGDLCHKCRRIYDALLASYEGDAQKVLSHIQVERFYLSRRYRRGIATIEPQMSVDARIHQVTADRSMAALPKALQHTSLFEPGGALVDANRGLLEYSDLLKRPVEAFKYLLATVETATVSMDSFMLHLDMVYIASTNETYLDAFKEHPDFPSFKGRMELIKVPYLLRYQTEKEIYTPHIRPRVVGRHVAPHAVDVAALWAVLTRMRRNDATVYPKETADVIASLTPLEKLHLYDTGVTPERLTTREAKELRHRIGELYREAAGYPNYEGRFGASAREIRTALLNAAHHEDYACLSPFAVLEEIRDLLRAASVYDFLRQEVVGKFHDHKAFLQQAEELLTQWADDEVRDAMGLASDNSYSALFARYAIHVSHWVKREKLVDPTSGKLMDPDEKFMLDIERVLISPGESKEEFRRSVIGTIGARALEIPEATPNYDALFHHYVLRLREDFYQSRRKLLRKINENFLKYTSDEGKGLDAKETEQVSRMLATLKSRYGYCLHCARDTVAYLLKKRYAE